MKALHRGLERRLRPHTACAHCAKHGKKVTAHVWEQTSQHAGEMPSSPLRTVEKRLPRGAVPAAQPCRRADALGRAAAGSRSPPAAPAGASPEPASRAAPRAAPQWAKAARSTTKANRAACKGKISALFRTKLFSASSGKFDKKHQVAAVRRIASALDRAPAVARLAVRTTRLRRPHHKAKRDDLRRSGVRPA